MGFMSSMGSSISSALSSGSLPLGDWSGGWTTFSSAQSRLKDAYKRAKSYAKWEALNMPSLTKQGLISANYNPMLALTNGMVDAGNPVPSSASGGSVSLGDFRPAVLDGLKKDNEVKDATKKRIEAETKGIKADTASKQVISRLAKFTGGVMDEVLNPQMRKQAVELVRRFMSSDGVDNMPAPSDGSSARGVKVLNDAAEALGTRAGSLMTKSNKNVDKFDRVTAEWAADARGLKGHERDLYIERLRREHNGRTYRKR